MDEDRKEKLRALTGPEVNELMHALKNGLDLGVSKGGFAIEEVAQVHQFLNGLVNYLNKAIFPAPNEEPQEVSTPDEVRKFVQGLYAAVQKASKNGGYTLDIGASLFGVFETIRQFLEVHFEDK